MPKEKRFCKVNDCNRPYYCQNLCKKHYERLRVYGRLELLPEQPRNGTPPQYPLPNIPKKELIAWAAGFFDGEGCIFINYFKKTKRHNLQIKVNQINPEPLKILQGLFGGIVRPRKTKSEKSLNKKPIFIWYNQSRQAYDTLLKIQPFLFVKKKQANLAIEFQQGIHRAIRNSITDSERQRRERIKNAISQLNQGNNNLFLF